DWPSQVALTGFVIYDRDSTSCQPERSTLPPIADDSPVVFTAGTGMMHAGEFFRTAVEACRRLGVPGCLITRHSEQVPDALPPGVVHLPYAPFSELLPRARAIVHYGGIGTIAQALLAGIPQLVVPQAFDQIDNANRLARLGVSGSNLKGRLGPAA